jgi:membrane protease YdiL (CAAX protease family)
VINSGGIDFLGDEKETMRVMKTVPVSPLKQILVKFAIPFFLSLISLAISLIVLLATSTIDYEIAIVGFIFSLLFLLGNDAMSLFNELKHPTLSSDSNVFFLTGLYLFIIPILLLASGLALEYLKVEKYYIYLALAGILLIFVVPFFISFKKKIYKYFMKLEVVN